MDIVMAYKHLLWTTKHTVVHRWVMEHTNINKKDKPATITPMVQENMECNNKVNACVEGDLLLGWFAPLPGYGAMLQLGGTWVTTHLRANIKFGNTSPPMINYIV